MFGRTVNGRAKSKSFAAKVAPTGSVNVRRMGGAQRYPSQSPAGVMVKTSKGSHHRHALAFQFVISQTTPNAPFSRPSGIVAEGVERQGCRESLDGPGMALRGVPLEQ